jgi:hypothetical protein
MCNHTKYFNLRHIYYDYFLDEKWVLLFYIIKLYPIHIKYTAVKENQINVYKWYGYLFLSPMARIYNLGIDYPHEQLFSNQCDKIYAHNFHIILGNLKVYNSKLGM